MGEILGMILHLIGQGGKRKGRILEASLGDPKKLGNDPVFLGGKGTEARQGVKQYTFCRQIDGVAGGA